MAYPSPPQIDDAVDQLKQVLKSVEQNELDVLKTPWPEIEKSVVKILRGAFQVNKPDHQMMAVALAGVLGARLSAELGAFWFPNRDALEGASMGFQEALIMLQPFGAVADALGSGNLAKLDALIADIRRTLAQTRFGVKAASAPKLGPEDYQRLFDPGFLQFTVVDAQKAKTVWEGTPATVSREIRDGLSRANQLPKEARQQMEEQLVGSLQPLDGNKGLMEQVDGRPRVAELLTHLFGSVDGTGFAPEEFWTQVVLPLLYIGAPTQFPPLDGDEIDAFKKGADPLALFVDVVPYQTPAVEDGLLGAIPASEIGLLHPAFARGGDIRLVQVKLDTLAPLLERFDPPKSKDALARFIAYLEEKAGQKGPAAQAGQQSLSDAAFILLTDLKRATVTAKNSNHSLCLRRVTEAEAASEQALAVLRTALRGSRIILA